MAYFYLTRAPALCHLLWLISALLHVLFSYHDCPFTGLAFSMAARLEFQMTVLLQD